jgi:hypothetical protein
MKKIIYLFLFVLLSTNLHAQNIKLFESYLRLNDMATRYVVVLKNNSIWWFAPGQAWKKSSAEGLPAGYNVKLISAYSKSDGDSRYVVVLENNSIWWFAPGQAWKKSSNEGLPSQHKIKEFNAYSKLDGTRYVALLEDNSIWWFAPGQPWKKSTTEGLPQ